MRRIMGLRDIKLRDHTLLLHTKSNNIFEVRQTLQMYLNILNKTINTNIKRERF